VRPDDDARAVDRLAFFGDAVFAVVLVLVVSHILLPENFVKSDVLHDAIGDAAPQLFGCAVAFGALATLWFEHHRLFNHLGRVSDGLLWGTLLFLGCIVMTSYPAAVFTKHLDAPVAIYFFAGALIVSGLVWAGLWKYVWKHALLAETDPDLERRVLVRSLSLPLVLALSLPFAEISFRIRGDHFSVAILIWIVAVPLARLALAASVKRSTSG
jgi:uncharacterized membrane protein